MSFEFSEIIGFKFVGQFIWRRAFIIGGSACCCVRSEHLHRVNYCAEMVNNEEHIRHFSVESSQVRREKLT